MDPAAAVRPPRKRTIARVIAAVVMWLVVGVLFTVASAWVIEAKLNQGHKSTWNAQHDGAHPWPYPAGPAWPPTASQVRIDRRPYCEEWEFSGFNRVPDGFNRECVMYVSKRGWPFVALARGLVWQPGPVATVNGWHLDVAGERILLPLGPLWPGFVLNTLFYAAIAWLLCWRIPIFIRRHRRRTLGLCVKCAYNRAGLAPGAACPECGHAPPTPSLSASSA